MKHLQRDLEALKRSILDMGSLVEQAVASAVEALLEGNMDLAEAVIQGDGEIDSREIAVEEDCLKMLALHQPVAVDLRFIVAVLKVNNDLERMGDLAQNIAERAVYLSTHEPIGVDLDFDRLVESVRQMVSMSLDALVNQDPHLARKVCTLDDEVDDYNRHMYVVLQDLMHHKPDTIERAVHTLSVARHLERIADLATNIAEDIVFMVEGDVIRHHLEDASSGGRAASER